jgi:uncharacterized protein DUF6011
MSEGKRLMNLDDALTFIKAGNARFTLRSAKTGERFTYRVRESQDGKVHFVSLLTGTDNESHYSYMGVLDTNKLRPTAKSKIAIDAPGFKAFDWTWYQMSQGRLPDALEIWHEGSCGRCGRALTVPESIDRGIGPECWKKAGVIVPQSDDEVTLELTYE